MKYLLLIYLKVQMDLKVDLLPDGLHLSKRTFENC